ncbi:MAG: FKBP-type peptidyl-prolyl cis-trans isomerase [Bacteroidales bacterium]|jgi:FKBP-type peptidyl-prolyl cis-trans isomerase|nr:FKBP-type peptidyl-prolyl cis-trans isomerase [Bacteroidales bacterium]
MTKRILFLLILASGIVSCNYFSKYPGYSKTKSGIYYKLLKFGEASEKAKPGDYLTVDIIYKTIDDSIFFEGRRKIQVTEPSFPGAIDECFLMLAKEEKAEFIISAHDFFTKTLETSLPGFLHQEDPMKVEIDMIEIQTEEDYYREKEAFLHWIEDFGEYEKVILRQFIDQQKIEQEPTETGLYHITLARGTGDSVRVGDTVTVHYEGRFLNGKFFDSTKRRNSPFQFVYGRKWQVIPGLEEAIGRMTEGEKAVFILPSKIGFGQTGSSTGIIPPYTSTIFEVELIEVIPGKIEKDTDLNKYD